MKHSRSECLLLVVASCSDKKDLQVAVTIRAGKISDVSVRHEEKIDLNATKITVREILDEQIVRKLA